MRWPAGDRYNIIVTGSTKNIAIGELVPPQIASVPSDDVQIKPERLNWLASMGIENSEESLFQIETLLVALDRFIRPGELDLLGAGDHPDGYKTELSIVIRTLRKILVELRHLQSEHDNRAILFGRFVEQTVLADRLRDQFLREKFNQQSPSHSFAMLGTSIEQLVQIGHGLMRAPDIQSSVFVSFGVLLKSLLYANKYFNPFLERGFSSLYDRIEHPLLQRAISQTHNEQIRAATGLMILSCMRLLRYLNMINPGSLQASDLKDSLPIFALVRSDMLLMAPIFSQRVPRMLQNSLDTEIAQKLIDVTESLTFQFEMEGRKVFDHVLLHATSLQKRDSVLNAVESAHGILTNFVQQSVVWLVQTLVPDVTGRDVFSDFVSRREQAFRLRQDIWVLNQLLVILEEQMRSDPDNAIMQELKDGVIDYIEYFKSFTLKHLRASDIEEFKNLCETVIRLCRYDWSSEDIREHCLFELNKYSVFVNTTMQCIEQRADLQDEKIEPEQAIKILRQFVPTRFIN